MFCCENCFDNIYIKKIFENEEIGRCDYCLSHNVRILDIQHDELRTKIFRCISPFTENRKGHPLSKWLTTQFNLFNVSLGPQNINKLLSDMTHGSLDITENYTFTLNGSGIDSELLGLWSKFKEDLKHRSRFAFTFNEKLQKALIEIMEINIEEIGENFTSYRARNGTSSHVRAYSGDEIMCPPKNLVGNGRINSKGIPYLYTASDPDTAIAEIRPSKAVPVSVAKLATTKPHRFVKLEKSKFNNSLPLYQQYELYRLANTITLELSKPIDSSTSDFGYLATQFIAELADSKNFDGIAFRSSLAEGTNYVFFREDNIQFVDSEIVDVIGIEYVTEPRDRSLSDEDFKF